MFVNKIKLNAAYKNNHLNIIQCTFLKLHTMTMGHYFLAILGALAVD